MMYARRRGRGYALWEIEGRANQELEKLWKEGNVQVLVPVVPFVINQISE